MKTIKIRLTLSGVAVFMSLMSVFAQSSPLGKTDFQSYLEAAPGLPNSIEEAAKRAYGANPLQPDVTALEKFFEGFYSKVENAENQYKSYADKLQAYGESQSEEDMIQKAYAESDKNPILRQMGGAEKVSKMSQEEAEVAARAAAAQYIQDPFAGSGVQSAGMTALYQKIVSDPAYAAKFQNMSEKEKEAELRKYMSNDQPQAKTPQQMAQEHQRFEQQMKDKNEVLHAMVINQKITDIQIKIGEVAQKYGEAIQAINNAKGNHIEINADSQQKYDKIPELSFDEAGRHKDPEQVKKLALETANKHRAFAISALKQYAPVLNELRSAYKQICADYLDFLKKNGYKVNGNMDDLFSGTNTELSMVSLELSLLGLSRHIADESKYLTKEIASWEKHYLETKATYQVK
ncbi:MAG: hypothetical protein IPJ74_08450 [Saprospiraceae bacterium]|nr:hypothetical protein [Saprospiraceae bacterium]